MRTLFTMLAFALGLLLAAAPAAAQIASTEPFSIAEAGLTADDVGAILDAGRGRYVAVGDRLVDVASSTLAGADAALSRDEGEALARAVSRSRLARLRSAADEGRLTDADRAEARALAAAHGALLAWRDRYFLETLNPNDDPDAPAAGGAFAPLAMASRPLENPLPGPDPLAARLRAALILDDHGDPAQAEALDMAVRLMLESPTARELSAEFLKLNRRVKVSFEPLEGSLVEGSEKRKHVTGVGAVTFHAEGDWVKINAGYLQTDPRYQFRQIPGTLAHELLGHAYNDARAANAGVVPAMNSWRGDEDTAGVTGWLVQAEVDGKIPDDPYCWSYLADPERYHRTLQLVTAYYAESVSPEEATRLDQVYAERLVRVQAKIAELQARLDDRTDWTAVLDHFEKVHGIEGWRLRGLRDDPPSASAPAIRVELGRLLEIRTALTRDLADMKDPVKRAQNAETAKLMRDPFFADSEKRLDALSSRLRAFAAAHAPAAKAADAVVAGPGVTVVTSLSWDDLRALYEKDAREHPEHWHAPAPDAKLTPGT